ncbi:hypothetical protein Dacet_2670 [Denitrovibrio acetiphilus DSM 12809]|uniref:Uncharacterized protein n=1 Tax=Denitrovibrio acetiphilus (strain DSM 12809 / NBRC 114555 / N2460) TaxID=522772 RepID=D4H571_DENA2|nr:hypothetical protein [Denitrovibrio acetiphilus]ADD69427.1 hypothetical protein Dacet_2670 [Denitrovibrio acetiphilus DSM 12809]
MKFRTQLLMLADVKLDEYKKYWSDIDKLTFAPMVDKADFELRNVTHQLTVYENSRGYYLVYGLATYLCALKVGVEKVRVRIMEAVDAQDVASLILRDLFDNMYRRVLSNNGLYNIMLAETVRHAWKSDVAKGAMLLMDSGATTKEKVADMLTIFKHATIFNFAQDKGKKKKRHKTADFVLKAHWLCLDGDEVEVSFDSSGRIRLLELITDGSAELLNYKPIYGDKYKVYEDTSNVIEKTSFMVAKNQNFYCFDLCSLIIYINLNDSLNRGIVNTFSKNPKGDITENRTTISKNNGVFHANIGVEEFKFVLDGRYCVASSDKCAKTKSKLYKHAIMPVLG